MKRLLAAFACAVALAAFGQADEVAKPDPAVEARLKDLGEELRCLVCQNETIAASQAPLALDLRNQIRTMIKAGKTDDEIRAYLVDRYGDFVLYKPPLQANTVLLWFGPFALLVLGGVVVVLVARSRRASAVPPAEVPPERKGEISSLLEQGDAREDRR